MNTAITRQVTAVSDLRIGYLSCIHLCGRLPLLVARVCRCSSCCDLPPPYQQQQQQQQQTSTSKRQRKQNIVVVSLKSKHGSYKILSNARQRPHYHTDRTFAYLLKLGVPERD